MHIHASRVILIFMYSMFQRFRCNDRLYCTPYILVVILSKRLVGKNIFVDRLWSILTEVRFMLHIRWTGNYFLKFINPSYNFFFSKTLFKKLYHASAVGLLEIYSFFIILHTLVLRNILMKPSF